MCMIAHEMKKYNLRQTTLSHPSTCRKPLQDITEEDAKREGVQFNTKDPASITNKGAYAKLWQSINGPKSWAHNPWVWVIKFKVLSTTGKPQNLINQ